MELEGQVAIVTGGVCRENGAATSPVTDGQ
jgi:hypothetical protein